MEQETAQTDETNLPDDDYQEEVEQDVTAESEGEESQDQTDPEDDSEEIEFNSKAYKLPKDIASAVKDMQKDYTVKTQGVADERKIVAEQRKVFEEQSQFHHENIKEVAQLEAINSTLAEFAQVDWGMAQQQDPAMFQQLVAQQKQLEEKHKQLAGSLNAKYQKSTQDRQLQEAKLAEESESEIKRIIKEWSPELDGKLQSFAADRYGFPKESIGDYKKDPKVAKLLHDAYVGQQIIQKQLSNKPKPTQANPVPTLSGSNGGKTSKSPAQMSDTEYAQWRKKGYA